MRTACCDPLAEEQPRHARPCVGAGLSNVSFSRIGLFRSLHGITRPAVRGRATDVVAVHCQAQPATIWAAITASPSLGYVGAPHQDASPQCGIQEKNEARTPSILHQVLSPPGMKPIRTRSTQTAEEPLFRGKVRRHLRLRTAR